MSRTYRRTKYTPEWVKRPVNWKIDNIYIGFNDYGYYNRKYNIKNPTRDQLKHIKGEYQRDGFQTMEQCDASFRRIRNQMLRSKNKQKMREFIRDTEEYDDYEFVPDTRDVLWHYY